MTSGVCLLSQLPPPAPLQRCMQSLHFCLCLQLIIQTSSLRTHHFHHPKFFRPSKLFISLSFHRSVGLLFIFVHKFSIFISRHVVTCLLESSSCIVHVRHPPLLSPITLRTLQSYHTLALSHFSFITQPFHNSSSLPSSTFHSFFPAHWFLLRRPHRVVAEDRTP